MARSVWAELGSSSRCVRVFRGISRSGEASYVAGRTGDALAKLEAPALGGRLRALGYGSENEFDAAATVTGTADGATDDAGRNVFEWESLSLGGEWTGDIDRIGLRVLGWSAASEASAAWLGSDDRLAMSSERQDHGILAAGRYDEPIRTRARRDDRSGTARRAERDLVRGRADIRRGARCVASLARRPHSRGDRVRASLANDRAAPRARLRSVARLVRGIVAARADRGASMDAARACHAQRTIRPHSPIRAISEQPGIHRPESVPGRSLRRCRRLPHAGRHERSRSRRSRVAVVGIRTSRTSGVCPPLRRRRSGARPRTRSRSRPRPSTSARGHRGELRPMPDGARESSGSR